MKIGDEKKRDKGPLSLDELKKNYEMLREKYSLPEFSEMNKLFSIEKIDGTETDLLMREIRRAVSETISNYLTVLENLLNPSNAPMFVFSIVKCINNEEKKKLSDIYMSLAREWAPIMQLDLVYSEENEAEFIKKVFKFWKKTSQEFYQIIEVINKNWGSDSESKKSGYLG
jgi:hypothetical protein